MKAAARNAVDAYQNVGVDVSIINASPHGLILLLFDGAVKAIGNARFHMSSHNVSEKGIAITKAIAIIDEGLNASLDVAAGGELAGNLSSLYEYMCHRLLQANIKNDTAALDEVSKLLIELRGAWASIEKAPEVIGASDLAPHIDSRQATATSYGKV